MSVRHLLVTAVLAVITLVTAPASSHHEPPAPPTPTIPATEVAWDQLVERAQACQPGIAHAVLLDIKMDPTAPQEVQVIFTRAAANEWGMVIFPGNWKPSKQAVTEASYSEPAGEGERHHYTTEIGPDRYGFDYSDATESDQRHATAQTKFGVVMDRLGCPAL